MQHQSLTAQIACKSKKGMENFEPTFFSEIPYCNVAQINYLRDLEEKKKNIDFPIFQFQKDFGEQAPVNEYDMLANTLYKKIMQNGYIQQKKAPSKKKKKTKNPFDYDYEDAWINDEEAITVKKNIYVKFENFQCLNQGVDQFYESEIYKSSIAQIQQMSKKRTNQISMDAQQLEQIKKKIKQNISIAHSKIKQEADAQKSNSVEANIDQVQKSVKNDNLIQAKLESQNFQQKTQVGKDLQVFKLQIPQSLTKNSQNVWKSDLVENIQKAECQQENIAKKTKKNISKTKSSILKKKKQKASESSQIAKQAPHDPENKQQSVTQKKILQVKPSNINPQRDLENFNQEGEKCMDRKQTLERIQGQKNTNQNQPQNIKEVSKVQ